MHSCTVNSKKRDMHSMITKLSCNQGKPLIKHCCKELEYRSGPCYMTNSGVRKGVKDSTKCNKVKHSSGALFLYLKINYKINIKYFNNIVHFICDLYCSNKISVTYYTY